MTEIRLFNPSEWQLYRDIRLASLQDSPDAFGSTYESSLQYSDELWRERLEMLDLAKQHPIAVFIDDAPVALAWGRVDPDDENTAILNQMWTHPDYRGRGLAAALVKSVIDWAQSIAARSVMLSVTVGNKAAKQLYLDHGFVGTGEVEPLRPGSEINVEEMRLDLRNKSSIGDD